MTQGHAALPDQGQTRSRIWRAGIGGYDSTVYIETVIEIFKLRFLATIFPEAAEILAVVPVIASRGGIALCLALLLSSCAKSSDQQAAAKEAENSPVSEVPPVAPRPTPPRPATWFRGELIEEGGRPNPYGLEEAQYKESLLRGRVHPLVYPVTVTGALLPYRSIKRFLDVPSHNPLRAILQNLSQAFTSIESFSDAMSWLGLHRFPKNAGTTPESIPLPPGYKVGEPMGLSKIKTSKGTGFTISCAGCHIGQLFGRPVFGLTNRFPRANQFFIRGKTMTELAPTPLFQAATGSSKGEAAMYRRTRHNMRFVDSKRPEVLGLDTSLAHVALSLARRDRDQFATKNPDKPYAPDEEILKTFPADSKPAVWWNVKYKNRFLSDGSVVSGNPIVTNILWNELGRGTDLHELEKWIADNGQILQELTTAVFSTTAPSITEFFPAEQIDLERAKRGQALFTAHCVRCHGQYEKAWDKANTKNLSASEILKTTKVLYPKSTRVVDVGTDSHRHQGMKSLLALNTLKISKTNGIQIETQNGYVPPPLVGIWARWPYFHNNSAPSLCAVLTTGDDRPETYWAGEPLNPQRDFDFECNGYPMGSRAPRSWMKSREYLFDSRRPGLGNHGHDEGILIKNGKLVFSPTDRTDLIQFLQTL